MRELVNAPLDDNDTCMTPMVVAVLAAVARSSQNDLFYLLDEK